MVHSLVVTQNVSGKKNYEDLLGFNNLSASIRQYFFKKNCLALSAICFKSDDPQKNRYFCRTDSHGIFLNLNKYLYWRPLNVDVCMHEKNTLSLPSLKRASTS
jgi:hypothetical protein